MSDLFFSSEFKFGLLADSCWPPSPPPRRSPPPPAMPVLDAATLDSSEGALAAATHAIFIGGQEIAHKDGLKMGQPVHYWNKMPFAPGLYQASVGDKLSFLFNTEHTVWLMPSADASDSCDFTNAVELAGPTYGLPDWPRRWTAP